MVENSRNVLMAELEPQSICVLGADAAHEAYLVAEAEADHVVGRVVPHERVREWLAKLATGQKISAPET